MTNAKKTSAVGAIFLSKKGTVLLNLRAPHKSYGLNWSLWGGMVEDGERPKDTLTREISEEMGFVPNITRIYPFDIFESNDKSFRYYTFVCVVEEEFIPILNSESSGYAWFNLGTWPKPLHSGLRKTFVNDLALAKLKLMLDQ